MKKNIVLLLISLLLVACVDNNSEVALNIPNPSADDVSQKKDDIIIRSTPTDEERKIMKNAVFYENPTIINGLSISIKDVLNTRVVYPSKQIDKEFNRYMAEDDNIYTKIDLTIKNTSKQTTIIKDLLSVYLYSKETDDLFKGFFILDTAGTVLPLEDKALNPNESITISALVKTEMKTIESFSKENFIIYIFGNGQACLKNR